MLTWTRLRRLWQCLVSTQNADNPSPWIGLQPLEPRLLLSASFMNSGFETSDLTGWESIGDVSVIDATPGVEPPEGTYHALLETNTGISDTEVTFFLGLPGGTLDTLIGLDATDGSAIKQDIEVAAGDVLTFQWDYLTNEAPADSQYNDFAFISIVDQTNAVLADTFSPLTASPDDLFDNHTAYQTFTHTFTNSGTFTVGLGVMNVDDQSVLSGLLVDDFQITTPVQVDLSVVYDGSPVSPGGTIDFGIIEQNDSRVLSITNEGDESVTLSGIRLPFDDDQERAQFDLEGPAGISVSDDGTGLFNFSPTLTLTPGQTADFIVTASTINMIEGGFEIIGEDDSEIFNADADGEVVEQTPNDAPSFTKGSDQVIDEGAGPQTVDNWATNISPGPAEESGQSVQFLVSNDNNSLFSVQPTISPDGTLTYTPQSDAAGSATVTVSLMDDGGADFGGDDTSDPQTFTITINPAPVLPGDVNQDDLVDVADIDALAEAIRMGDDDSIFDLNSDSVVDHDDRNLLIRDILTSEFGDANLDHVVGIADLALLSEHFGLLSGVGFGQGDFNGDGQVGIADLALLSEHFGIDRTGEITASQSTSPDALAEARSIGNIHYESTLSKPSLNDPDTQANQWDHITNALRA